MTDSQTSDSLRYRRRLAEEWLLENGRWRDNLNDVQAQRLLNWARDYVNIRVAETAVLSDDAFEEMIDGVITAVLRVMRDVDKLTSLLNQLDEESARQQIQKFSDDCAAVLPHPLSAEDIEQILHQHPHSFNTLYQILIPQAENSSLSAHHSSFIEEEE